jgi:hypothetical protein
MEPIVLEFVQRRSAASVPLQGHMKHMHFKRQYLKRREFVQRSCEAASEPLEGHMKHTCMLLNTHACEFVQRSHTAAAVPL